MNEHLFFDIFDLSYSFHLMVSGQVEGEVIIIIDDWAPLKFNEKQVSQYNFFG